MAAETVHGALTARPLAVPAWRSRVAADARRLSRLTFAAAIVLSPFRAALVLVARPKPPVYDAYTDFTITAGEAAIVLTLGLWAIGLAARPRPVSFGPAFLRLPLAALLAVAWLGVPFSIDPALSAYNAVELVALAALALYVLNEVDSIAGLAVPIALMIAVQSLFAIGQLVMQRSLGLGWLGELSLDPSQNGASVVAATGTARLLRAYGLTDHPNILGGLLAFALPLAVFGRSWAGRSGSLGRAGRAGLIALALAGLFATFSRAAWLAAAVALVVGALMLAWSRSAAARPAFAVTRRRVAVALAVAAVAAVLLVPYLAYVGVRTGLAGGASVTETMSIGERTILAGAAVSTAMSHPLTGTGLGTLPLALRDSNPGLTFAVQPAHVVLLDVAAETGVLGAVCFVAVLVAPWLALVRERRRWRPEIAAVSAALAAVTVVGFFDYYTWTWPAGRFWAWLVLGLWAGAYTRARAGRSNAR